MEKPKKGYNVFFDPYKAVTVGTMPDIKVPFCEPLPEWFELPWRGPVRQRMSNMPDELGGIPFLLDKKSNRGGFDKKAYQREYMRKRRNSKI